MDKYPDMGEVTGLRLELGRERDRANAFEAAFSKKVIDVIAEAAKAKDVADVPAQLPKRPPGTPGVSPAWSAEALRRAGWPYAEEDKPKAETLDGADIHTWKLRSDNWQKFCQLHIDEIARLNKEIERLSKDRA